MFVVALAALLLPIAAGCATATPEAASSAASAAPASIVALFGGSVQYQRDGAPATTEVNLSVSGAGVSGTAVSDFGAAGKHTVELACAGRNGETWALGGKTKETTIPGEKAGDWSAVIVKDGSPQQIGIWVSEDPEAAADCDAFLTLTDFANVPAEIFEAVESGALVPPPDAAP